MLNPYRYGAKRLDPATATYDMGARRFGPDLARFLQVDLHQGALADLGLSLDPLTRNRYAFAGGNPVSFVETDGHAFSIGDEESGGGCVSVAACTDGFYAVKQPIADAIGRIGGALSGAWEAAKPGLSEVAYETADAGNAYARGARELSYGVADSGYGALEKAFATRDAENLPGSVLLVNNARGPVGDFVAIWGDDNTMTLGANLIVSHTKLQPGPARDHELIHVEQAEVLGPLYPPTYLALQIPAFVMWFGISELGGVPISFHDWHVMEIHAQLASDQHPFPSLERMRR